MEKSKLSKVVLLTTFIAVVAQAQSYGQTLFTSAPDGIRIAYQVHGDKKQAIVFVHGWSCDRTYWKEQIEPFAENYHVVTIDLGGHGESGLGRRSWTMEAFGADVTSVVKKLGLKNAILVGHSMGGCVAAEASRQLPHGAVAGIVIVDQYKQLHTPSTPEEIEAFASRLEMNFADSTASFVRRIFGSGSDSSLIDRVAKDMSSAPPSVALEAFRSTWRYSSQITETLKELKLPVIAINSDNRPTDITSMERYGVQVMIMPNVGHFLMMEDPGAFNLLLKTAIQKIVR